MIQSFDSSGQASALPAVFICLLLVASVCFLDYHFAFSKVTKASPDPTIAYSGLDLAAVFFGAVALCFLIFLAVCLTRASSIIATTANDDTARVKTTARNAFKRKIRDRKKIKKRIEPEEPPPLPPPLEPPTFPRTRIEQMIDDPGKTWKDLI